MKIATSFYLDYTCLTPPHHLSSRRNALIGRWSKALSLCETTARYLPRLTSISVVGLSTHSLAIAYGLMGMHDRAHTIFAALMRTETESNAFSVFRDLNPYYAELYAKRADLESAKSKKEKQTKMDFDREEERLVEKRRVREEMQREVARNEGPHNALASEAGLPREMETWDLDGIMGQNKTRPPNSFSSVVTAVMKVAQAKSMMKKMISEKKEQRLKRIEGCVSPESAAAAAAAASPEKQQQQPSLPSSPVRSSDISKPLEGTGTISFQLSLMTGRGMDSVKAELCMLNALTVESGAQVTSHLEDSGTPLTAEEYCEEGLKCIANIFVESASGTKISNYSHTCDQVHTLLVEAKLYSILERISAYNTLSSPRYDAYRDSAHSSLIRNDSEDCSLARTASCPPSLTLSPFSTPSESRFPTPRENSSVIGRDRKYYAAKAAETMKRCELLARAVDAPGVLFLTGLKMISTGIDAQAGRIILTEAIDIIEVEERNRLSEIERVIEQREKQKQEDIRAKARIPDEREMSSEALPYQYLDIEASASCDSRENQQFNIEMSEAHSSRSHDTFENIDFEENLESDTEAMSSWSGSRPTRRSFSKLVPARDSRDIPIIVDARRALGG